MRPSAIFLLGAASWVQQAVALPAAEDVANRQITSLCYTAVAKTEAAAKVATTTTTSTVPCTSTSTKTRTETSTPKAVTSTVTSISTKTHTAAKSSTLTDTVTNTKTLTTVTTTTTTQTATESGTVSGVSTETVPTSSGFLPVQSTLPGTSYDGQGGNGPVKVKRDDDESLLEARSKSKSYVQSVKCLVVEKAAAAKCSTTVAHTTVTSVAPTPTSTKTVTSVSITTVVPDATKTVTRSTSTYITSTATSTTQTTVTSGSTIYTATTTVYEACASPNVVDVYTDSNNNDYQISGIYNYAQQYPGPGYDQMTIDTAYDCCVAGLIDPHPGAVWQYQPAGNQCYINYVAAGDPEAQADQSWEVNNVDQQTLVVGNLYYGKIDLANF